MPIPLGVLAVAGAVAPVGAAGAYELLETQIIAGTSTASVTFSNLNSTYGSTYEHLQVRFVAKSLTNLTFEGLEFRLNAGAANTTMHRLYGTGSSVVSNYTSATGYGNLFWGAAGSDVASQIYSAHVMDILDAFNTNKNTTIKTFGGRVHSGDQGVGLQSSLYLSTAAVDSIQFRPTTLANYAAGSRFSLYGLRSS